VGEAKRRRERGGTITHAANPGHVEDYRVPEGHIAFTLDLAGVDPTTFSFEAEKLSEFMAGFDKIPSTEHSKPGNHVVVRENLIEATKRARGGEPQELIMLSIWCTMFHPTSGEAIRDGVSQSLRETGKAHVTISMDAKKNFGCGLGEKFVDAQKLLDAVPEDFKGSKTRKPPNLV
jgi:hypothetical protein